MAIPWLEGCGCSDGRYFSGWYVCFVLLVQKVGMLSLMHISRFDQKRREFGCCKFGFVLSWE